ncbi:MAG: hypothetical protein K5922_07030 [Clostridiales bacterium]|nr:hypothetical protein [Clostridiales bacterium]
MKKTLLIVLGLLLCLWVPAAAETPQREITVMVYMCGSNLESSYGSASGDLLEMMEVQRDLKASSVLVMTGGTRKWAMGYPADMIQVREIGRNVKIWESEAQNMGARETLRQFLRLGIEKFPAKEYALILWDHGGGPLDGVCWDELFSMDGLSLEELCGALEEARLPKKLSWIGFDACLMGSAEVACALAPYAEYMIASQELEPASGWDYSFLERIEQDRTAEETGKRIIDAYTEQKMEQPNPLTLSCVHLGRLEQAMKSVDAFFSNVSSSVSVDSYDRLSRLRFSSIGFGKAAEGGGSGYDLVDLQDLIRQLGRNGNEAAALAELENAIVYTRSTVSGATGLSVYHPFSNKQKYLEGWKTNYETLSFSPAYRSYISRFGSILTSDVMAEWSGLHPEGEYREETRSQMFSLQLTEKQRKTCARAQLLILAAYSRENGIYHVAGTEDSEEKTVYYPVSVSTAELNSDGVLTAEFTGRTLYATDENGIPLCGPLPYELSADGKTCYVRAGYQDQSGREDAAESLPVLYSAAVAPDGEKMEITGVQGYDPAQGGYTPRVPVAEEHYTVLRFSADFRYLPGKNSDWKGFESWEEEKLLPSPARIELPMKWQLRFFDTQMSAAQLYATFQITDTQQNLHSSLLKPVLNPNLEVVQLQPRETETENYRLRFYLLRDTAPLSPGLNLAVEATNLSLWDTNYIFKYMTLNGNQCGSPGNFTPLYLSNVRPGETRIQVFHMEGTDLTNLPEVREISCMLYVYYINHTNANRTENLRLEVNRCSLEGIADQTDQVLGRAEQDGLTWELIRLERNRYGDYEGLLKIINQSEQELEGFSSAAINGILTENPGEGIILNLPGHTTGYRAFTVRDRCTLKKNFIADGRLISYTLNAKNLLEQHGVEQIRTLHLIHTSGYRIQNDCVIRLQNPVPTEKTGAGRTETVPLMRGQVEAELERVFLADDGVGLRIVFSNPSDRPVLIRYGGYRVNGRPSTDRVGNGGISIPAGGKTVHCLGVQETEPLPEGEKIQELSLIFRVDNEYCSTEACLRFHREEGQSRYLSGTECEVVPAVLERPEIRFVRDSMDVGEAFTVRVRGAFYSGSLSPWGDSFDREDLSLGFFAEVTNREEKSRRYVFSDLVLNGSRVTDQHWWTGEVRPGETVECELYLPMSGLEGLTEIREISCSVFPYSNGDYHPETAVTVAFETEPADLSAMAPPAADPMAEAAGERLTWKLLSLEEDEAGGLHMRLLARNDSEEEFRDEVWLLVNDWVIERIYDLRMMPGQEQILELQAENRVSIPSHEVEVFQYAYPTDGTGVAFPLEDHVLEHRGIRGISEIRVLSGVNPYAYTVREDLRLELKHPAQLSDTAPWKEEERLQLFSGPLEVFVNQVLVGDVNIAVSLDLCNHTEIPLTLTAQQPEVNGKGCSIHEYTSPFDLPPFSNRTVHLSLIRNPDGDGLQRGDAVQDITLSWSLNGEPIPSVTFTLLREAPLGRKGGTVVTGADLMENVSKAKLLMLTSIRMKAETISPVQLVPALNEEQTERFESGTAVVYLQTEANSLPRSSEAEQTSGGAGLTELRRICSIELQQDGTGRISAPYSGLALVNSLSQVLEDAEFPEENGDGIAAVWFIGGIYRDLQAYRSLPEEISLDDSSPYAYLVAGYLIDAENGVPVITGHAEFAANEEGENVTESLTEAEEQVVCAAEQQVLTVRDGETLHTGYERRQIVRLDDLGFVRADSLPGKLMVRYDLKYRDGSAESVLESYPYSAFAGP